MPFRWWVRLLPKRVGLLSLARGTGLSVLLILAVMTMWPGLFAASDPLQTQPEARLQGPSREHIFGTDYLGRDIFARVVYGARISLVPSVVVVMLAAAVGSLLGLVAGYTGGLTDELLMRVTDVFLAIPALILAIAIATALGPSVSTPLLPSLSSGGRVSPGSREARRRCCGRRNTYMRRARAAQGGRGFCSSTSCPTCSRR